MINLARKLFAMAKPAAPELIAIAMPAPPPPAPEPVPEVLPGPVRNIQGYVDEISLTHINGWLRDLDDAAARVAFDVVTEDGRAVAAGVGDIPYPPLAGDSFGDGCYGFALALPMGLTARERAGLAIRPQGGLALQRAQKFQGFVDQRSTNHVAGWVRNRFDPVDRLAVEVVLATDHGEVLIGEGIANRFYNGLALQNIGDAFYGYLVLFKEPLTEAERDRVIVRPVGAPEALPLSPRLDTRFDLVSYAAMDIVNNCNLRCPFCLFDYSDTKSTRFMSDETFDAALRLLPLVSDAGFWLSCLHEPSLHPKFIEFIERIPRQWRRKVMFTTNLAKRMPESYFAALADSGVYHINVSIESLDPPVYEKFRKGARFPIFRENWDKLIAAWRAHPNPPRLRYIMMAYQSNLRTLPELIKYLRAERCAWQIEIRYTFDLSHIPESFRRAEYLSDPDWTWLREQLAIYPIDEVILTEPWEAPRAIEAEIEAEIELEPEATAAPVAVPALPGAPPAPPPVKYPALPLNLHVKWDGRFAICDKWDHPDDQRQIAAADINELDHPYDFLIEVSNKPLPGLVQGYIDEVSTTGVIGWMRDAIHPEQRVSFNVAVSNASGTRIIASAQAGNFYQALKDFGWEDANYGFAVTFDSPITPEERDSLEIIPLNNAATPLRRAPRYQGYVDERSTHHIAGWLRDRFATETRVEYQIVLEGAGKERILATGIAQIFQPELAKSGVGDGHYGFHVTFDTPLTEAERDRVIVRPALGTQPLALSPRLGTSPEMAAAK